MTSLNCLPALCSITTYPRGMMLNIVVVLVSLLLFVYWTKKKALISFRAWALFMTTVHLIYCGILFNGFRKAIAIGMEDIIWIKVLEVIATFFTILRLYFIIEAYQELLQDKDKKILNVNPAKKIVEALGNAVQKPENPQEIRKNGKKNIKRVMNLREKLIKILF